MVNGEKILKVKQIWDAGRQRKNDLVRATLIKGEEPKICSKDKENGGGRSSQRNKHEKRHTEGALNRN